MENFPPTSTLEFLKANGFTFQDTHSQSEKELCAYHRTLDGALDEITDEAFAALGQLEFVPDLTSRVFRDDIIALLVENLHQHEMLSGGALYYRSYLADEPGFGLRVEFWGEAVHLLPQALTAKAWFTALDRPWEEEVAPHAAIQGGGAHTALSDLFNSLQRENLAEVVYLSWREDNRQEGPDSDGHIIAVHFTVGSKDRDHEGRGQITKPLVGPVQTAPGMAADDVRTLAVAGSSARIEDFSREGSTQAATPATPGCSARFAGQRLFRLSQRGKTDIGALFGRVRPNWSRGELPGEQVAGGPAEGRPHRSSRKSTHLCPPLPTASFRHG